MQNKTAMLGLLAETPIHAGTGSTLGVIDLPIQREAHTGWPCVYGSAVKGALRTAATAANYEWVNEVFGPDTGNASEHAGALAVGEARLLLLPVRSLTTHFKWVTCPGLLRRFFADCRRTGLAVPLEIPNVAEGMALVHAAPTQPMLFLEEFRLSQSQVDLAQIITQLAILAGAQESTRLEQQLVIVHDDLFAHLASFATPVAAHVALDSRTKTAKTGALWYEETLPPETLLYVCLLAQCSRRSGSELKADDVLAYATETLFPITKPYLQLGGNETVGMGWCRVSIVKGA